MIQPIVLWSDSLIFLLVATVIFFLRTVSKSPQLRKRWSQVFSSKVGMVAFIVICMYILIALLDSLHFREALDKVDANSETEQVAYSNEVKSVLDVLLQDITKNTEKSYSTPFSLYGFEKENMQDENGNVYRDYPRLKYAGSHLDNESERTSDILWRTLIAVAKGLLFASLLVGLHVALRMYRKGKFESHIPWHVAYLSIAVISVIVAWVNEIGSVYHIFGTDKVGTDVMVQSIKAIRTGVLIGILATLLTLPIAIFLGISAGYFKGWIDDLVQYIYTTLSSIPSILLIAASVLLIDVYIETHAEEFDLTAIRSDFKFLALCGILGLTSWTTLCRLLRAETLKVSQLDYVQAAHAFGVSHARVIGKHILPNVTHIILISLVLDFSIFVLAEAVLSYIGVGVDPTMASWGNMINAARFELARDPVVWWSVISAFSFMFTLVLAANLFSDEVREAFDPRSAKGEN